MSLFGPPNVEKLKNKSDVEGLIKALEYEKDKFIPEAAAKALRELGDPRTMRFLTTALRSEENIVRSKAALSLGTLGDPQAVEPLLNALKDRDNDVKKAVIVAFVALGNTAIGPLIVQLRNKEWGMRMAAASMLEVLGRALVTDARIDEALTSALEDIHPRVREAAAYALKEFKPPQEVDELVRKANEKIGRVENIIDDALGKALDKVLGK